jgi:hypothetical protein
LATRQAQNQIKQYFATRKAQNPKSSLLRGKPKIKKKKYFATQQAQ